MGEHHVPRMPVERLRIGEEFADGVIGEMPGAAHDALLDVPRIGADLQHIEIVIGLEHQAVRIAQVNLYQLRQVAEVGHNRYLHTARAECESQRIDGVVRNRNRRHFNIAHNKSLPGADVFHAIQALVRSFRQDTQNFSVCRFSEIHSRAPLAQHLSQRTNMIGVFVGDNDAIEPIYLTARFG